MQKKLSEKRKLFFTSTVYTFPLIILLSTLTIALFFHPSIRPRWDKNYRSQLFNSFLENTLSSGQIDAKNFWLFRERFSPGYFELNQVTTDFKQTFAIIDLYDSRLTPLLFYHSPFMISIDYVSRDPLVLEEIKENEQGQIIFENEELYIAEFVEEKEANTKTYNLWFILPIELMKETNGLFDYTSEESELLENTYWLNNSEVTLYL